ncbi:phosphopantetheine-binding protein [Labrenzia sp. PHM005]|uniref:phosphopantetheine-binding protein n=1 Tax=Labrenzia sp. PHM005 TaxID=2590016 RepID=UPI0011400F93|nr:phosphopantetheine-binding protein [Labrenzia sp. PHM005]QDG75022.1 acyl carrier protein [Labrenzia sp. PHM005]
MSQTDPFETVKRNVQEVLPELEPDMIQPESILVDLGANSVDRMDVITLSMEDMGIAIPLMSFAKAVTLRDLAEILAASKV